MKTTHDTLTSRENKSPGMPTAGGERRRLTRGEGESGGGRIVDFEAWKAAHPEALPLPEGPADGETARPASPRRGFMYYALQGAELLATLCVVGVLLALVLRVLM